MTAAETMDMELAYQIQKRLYESSLTAEVFAQQCGVPEELVAQAMEEKSIPIEAVQKICDTLGISVDSLRRMPVSGNFVELQRLVVSFQETCKTQDGLLFNMKKCGKLRETA